MNSGTQIHLHRLHALLRHTRQECENYEEPISIQVKVGGKVFMELSKASLLSDSLLADIDHEAFEQAIQVDSSLQIDAVKPVA